jgi:hypothetical protein
MVAMKTRLESRCSKNLYKNQWPLGVGQIEINILPHHPCIFASNLPTGPLQTRKLANTKASITVVTSHRRWDWDLKKRRHEGSRMSSI